MYVCVCVLTAVAPHMNHSQNEELLQSKGICCHGQEGALSKRGATMVKTRGYTMVKRGATVVEKRRYQGQHEALLQLKQDTHAVTRSCEIRHAWLL